MAQLPAGTLVYEISGPMFFGAVEHFERSLLHTHTEPGTLIIRLRSVPFMDITGIQTLDDVVVKLRKRGVRVVLCEANARVLAKLRNAGVLRAEAGDQYTDSFSDALRRMHGGIASGIVPDDRPGRPGRATPAPGI